MGSTVEATGSDSLVYILEGGVIFGVFPLFFFLNKALNRERPELSSLLFDGRLERLEDFGLDDILG